MICADIESCRAEDLRGVLKFSGYLNFEFNETLYVQVLVALDKTYAVKFVYVCLGQVSFVWRLHYVS